MQQAFIDDAICQQLPRVHVGPSMTWIHRAPRTQGLRERIGDEGFPGTACHADVVGWLIVAVVKSIWS